MYLGVRGTPAFFINGRLLAGAQPFKAFESVIERALKDAASPAKRGNR
jgi:protein-disulfide isomerase